MSGKQSLKPNEALALQSGVAGHDYLTGSTSYAFSSLSFAAGYSYSPTHWYCIISTEGDATITATCAIGDAATSITIKQWVPYLAPVTSFTCGSSSDKFLAYPA